MGRPRSPNTKGATERLLGGALGLIGRQDYFSSRLRLVVRS